MGHEAFLNFTPGCIYLLALGSKSKLGDEMDEGIPLEIYIELALIRAC